MRRARLYHNGLAGGCGWLGRWRRGGRVLPEPERVSATRGIGGRIGVRIAPRGPTPAIAALILAFPAVGLTRPRLSLHHPLPLLGGRFLGGFDRRRFGLFPGGGHLIDLCATRLTAIRRGAVCFGNRGCRGGG